jgi:hypothetical protein
MDSLHLNEIHLERGRDNKIITIIMVSARARVHFILEANSPQEGEILVSE